MSKTKQKGGVFPKIYNDGTLTNKKAAILIIGAGPVGLYLAYKFLISNVFSDVRLLQCLREHELAGAPRGRTVFFPETAAPMNPLFDNETSQGNYNNSIECANQLVIRIVEARENLDQQFLRDFNLENLNDDKFPDWWKLWLQGDTRGFLNFKNAYEQNPRLRFFASRKQVFFINRDILTSWDPWLRRLVSQISCGTTTTPNRWGILKCILRSNPGEKDLVLEWNFLLYQTLFMELIIVRQVHHMIVR